MSGDYLLRAQETYDRNSSALRQAGVGRHVLIHGEDIVGVWDTYEDALKAGYEQFGVDDPFVVKRIHGPVDGVQFFTRDIPQCQS